MLSPPRSIFLILITFLFNHSALCQVYKFENPTFTLDQRIDIAIKQTLNDNFNELMYIGYAVTSDGELDTADDLFIALAYSFRSYRPALKHVIVSTSFEKINRDRHPIYLLGNASQIQSLKTLFKLFSEIHYNRQRQDILDAVGEHPPQEAINKFLSHVIFNHYHPALQQKCIDILGRFGDAESLEHILDILARHDDTALLRRAIYSISLRNDPERFRIISALATGSKKPEIRKEAIFNLSHIHRGESLATLYEVVNTDADPDLRKFAVFSISRFPVPVACQVLLRIARSHQENEIRKKALYWLRNLYHHKALS
ncbi:MAG: HEAT repeat domain-containing protein [candidate division KSB1 bacterium]|jgi:hypothetical protein|nr:HEAT repeat domain-containing protein [candidate division KSB1 bacterium]